MKYIGLYKMGKDFIISPMAKTKTGGLIDSMKYMKIGEDSSSSAICSLIRTALGQYKENVSNPVDWKKFASEQNEKLKVIGLKSMAELNSRGNKYCLIKAENEELQIIPSENKFQKKYFAHLTDLTEYISLNAGDDDILKAIANIFVKCK